MYICTCEMYSAFECIIVNMLTCWHEHSFFHFSVAQSFWHRGLTLWHCSGHLSCHHAVRRLCVFMPTPLLGPLRPSTLWGGVWGGLRLPSGILLQPPNTHLCAKVRQAEFFFFHEKIETPHVLIYQVIWYRWRVGTRGQLVADQCSFSSVCCSAVRGCGACNRYLGGAIAPNKSSQSDICICLKV